MFVNVWDCSKCQFVMWGFGFVLCHRCDLFYITVANFLWKHRNQTQDTHLSLCWCISVGGSSLFLSLLHSITVGMKPQLQSCWLADWSQHGHCCIHACHSGCVIINRRQIAERKETGGHSTIDVAGLSLFVFCPLIVSLKAKGLFFFGILGFGLF